MIRIIIMSFATLLSTMSLVGAQTGVSEHEAWGYYGPSALVERINGRVSFGFICGNKRVWTVIRTGDNVTGFDLGPGMNFDGLGASLDKENGKSQGLAVKIMYQKSGQKGLISDGNVNTGKVVAVKLRSGRWVLLFLDADFDQFLNTLKGKDVTEIYFYLYGEDYDTPQYVEKPLQNPNFTTFSISLEGAAQAINKVQSSCK